MSFGVVMIGVNVIDIGCIDQSDETSVEMSVGKFTKVFDQAIAKAFVLNADHEIARFVVQ
ncbi:hypothetical protein [Candidatus Reidiella endopervernicosa]|uniref:Uncharacterized protein n=1 Tax=Candidatus Reidiella endopervernicosa TaxID=2738883 RepID=A0A6N0HX16_9GAMM|nr:hypothetical protein [Candidatus Reidiella endopervernicosa]QKQ26925.1 hypothetical protein HUE57_12020 [Candidatus Reidiella endopervernicosa]